MSGFESDLAVPIEQNRRDSATLSWSNSKKWVKIVLDVTLITEQIRSCFWLVEMLLGLKEDREVRQ